VRRDEKIQWAQEETMFFKKQPQLGWVDFLYSQEEEAQRKRRVRIDVTKRVEFEFTLENGRAQLTVAGIRLGSQPDIDIVRKHRLTVIFCWLTPAEIKTLELLGVPVFILW